MLACCHLPGKTPELTDRLHSFVIGMATSVAHTVIMRAVILPVPHALWGLSMTNAARTADSVICRRDMLSMDSWSRGVGAMGSVNLPANASY